MCYWALRRWNLSWRKISFWSATVFAINSTLVSPGRKLRRMGGARPYTISKGVFACCIVKGYIIPILCSTQLQPWLGLFRWKHCKYDSIVLFSTSDWASVWGWYVELNFKWVSCNLKISVQKLLGNKGSRSLTIDLGIPCKRTIFLVKVSTIDFAVKGCFKGIKCPYLDSRSTTTRMQSTPFDFGSPVIKSRVMCFQMFWGIGRGWSRLAGDKISYLCF